MHSILPFYDQICDCTDSLLRMGFLLEKARALLGLNYYDDIIESAPLLCRPPTPLPCVFTGLSVTLCVAFNGRI